MKRSFTIAVCLLMAVAACSSFKEEQGSMECAKRVADEVFYATLEQSGAADATKVYADENLKVLWNADDRITIFNRYTYGYEYAFQGATGKTAGTFAKVDEGTEFVTGNALDEIYAVYPYGSENEIDNAGNLTITWPSTQTYKPDSFGIGANVMVSVTDDNQLRFRNVGGYLALKLYGDNVSVSSITLRGNNGEKLSGRATITCATGTNPELSFQPESQGSLQLNCTSPVHIGSTAESATTFWLVVPPTHFTHGFNITVRTSDGLVFFKSTDLAYDIERNTLTRMAAVEVIPGDIIPFEDANFKAYCVENFDTNNDSEISVTEALAVTVIDVCTDNITSLIGVEFFANLTSLSCHGNTHQAVEGRLTSLDVSNNKALNTLDCEFNQLTFLDVSNNTDLINLDCEDNQLTTLDVRNNTALAYLDCSSNQLSSLDVSYNNTLSTLWCYGNQLTSLDVSNNTGLTYLFCSSNQLTSLDVSQNTALTILLCNNNQLQAIDVSYNTDLTELWCGQNQLISLDVSHNTVLTDLECAQNQLTTLNLSNNTSLTDLFCYENQLSALELGNNTALSLISCGNNLLTALDLSNNTALTGLSCYNNLLTSLNVCGCSDLRSLYCYNNQLTALNVSFNTALKWLHCYNNQLTSLDVSNNTLLQELRCNDNYLSSLDVSNNTALTLLNCESNSSLTEIWLRIGQTIQITYDSNVSQVYYKE